jgi:phenylacetate-CoA ligase
MMTSASIPWSFTTGVPDVIWPALPSPGAAAVLALGLQLEQSQWWPADKLGRFQLRQLDSVVRHAHNSVPFYRERWNAFDSSAPLGWEAFSALPLLERRDLQSGFERLKSDAYPAQHGATRELRTSGSTGAPVRVLKNAFENTVWQALLLRDHAWHQRDLAGKLAVIRQGVPRARVQNWGATTNGIVNTGPMVTLPVSTDVSEQLAWLAGEEPDYLLSHPSNVAALAQLSLKRGARLGRLRDVRTSGEIVSGELRDLCRAAWNVPVNDMYSSNETGYMALQCPQHEHYHVQSEGVFLEVLDGQGRPCGPAETGRIVVTTFHNFAMPLVRYVIGDYAEVGPACPCGRGLPVLSRILGRVRNMLVTADGKSHWPAFSVRSIADMIPLRQYQFVQKALDLIEARLVISAPLTGDQEAVVCRHLLSQLPPGFRVKLTYHSEIPRGAGGKFEDYVSEIAPGQ